MATYIYSRNARRGLVRQLSRALHIRCVDSDTRPRPRDVRLINWGNSVSPNWHNRNGTRVPFQWMLNSPEAVGVMAHKIRCFEALRRANVPTLEWTTDRAQAQRWLDEDGSVYVRNVLTGHSGEGLVFLQQQEGRQRTQVPQAPLYTRNYRTPFKEYRVHVVNGQVIDMTMKQRMGDDALREHGFQVPDDRQRLQVRTYANGWVFARGELQRFSNDTLRTTAVNAIRAVGADFGAVDMVAHWRNGRMTDCAVVEINSAPALRSESTLRAYTQAFGRLIEGRRG